jgi:hypothetical protein
MLINEEIEEILLKNIPLYRFVLTRGRGLEEGTPL